MFLSSYGNMSGSLGEWEMLSPQLFKVVPNFHECLYNLIETQRICFLFIVENIATKKMENNL